MKKIFTLICALVGLAATAFAATINDVAVCKHSYVLVCDEYTNNGIGANGTGVKPGKGNLFGDGFFLDVTGGSVSIKKKNWDLSSEAAIAILGTDKYAEYGMHLNSFRLKNGQDAIAMKVTAGSKIIILGEKHSTRYPQITDQAPSDNKMQGTDLSTSENTVNTVSTNGYFSWEAPDDMTIYIGSQGGDYYISYVIVEAKEAPGTPSVKVGPQTYDEANGLWYRDVTVKPVMIKAEDSDDEFESIVTYTTDGSTPNASSEVVPVDGIRCYKDMTLKFQAYADFMGDGSFDEESICQGADNEGIVSFSFDAPTISVDGGKVTISSEYVGAKNYYKYGEDEDYTEGNSFTLTESATVTVMSKIVNGSYATFETASTTKDVYVLNPIKENKVISVTAGTAVVDEEATATSTTGTVYKIEGGAISADKMDFFVKNLEFAALANNTAVAQYQVPEGQEAYIKMNATNITFEVAENDSVKVHVICSKNSCKNIESETASDRQCKVYVDDKTYGCDDINTVTYDITDAEGNVAETLPTNEIKFTLGAGVHTFKKFSGTGNILISSIEFTPLLSAGISEVSAAKEAKVKKTIENGQVVIIKGNQKYNAVGAQIK